ncbi:MAG: nickel pincer cofactor biosynthesis protein LarC [Selenomonadales bacterium]|nr:nickel pincer cofactor biosynthesis protein LarC [Selenomonadales bacterium]
MNAIYLDCFSGISGNMLLGAFVDCGVSLAELEEELKKLGISDEYYFTCEAVSKCGIAATHLDVEPTNKTHGHHHHHDHSHSHSVFHKLMHKIHHHHHDHDHDHHHHHSHDGHTHSHSHGEHGHSHDGNRNLPDIVQLIEASSLSDTVKKNSIKVFTCLAKAEAKVHGKTIEEVHFHEVGAVDTIVDIIGNVICMEKLGIEKIFYSKVHVGNGYVNCAHGRMPVPAPAAAELLLHVPHYKGDVMKELATPTGAAILSAFGTFSETMPSGFAADKTGYGAGGWDLEIPNVLRMTLGTWQEEASAKSARDTKLVIETNIDDMNPQNYEYVLERLFAAGAVDAYLTPIIMKKNRPAIKISVLVDAKHFEEVSRVLFEETTTIGIRYYAADRKIAVREFCQVETELGTAQVKISSVDGIVTNIMPEYEDCKKIAKETGTPLKRVQERIKEALMQQK